MYFYVFVFLIREHPKLDKKHEASVQNLKELVSSVPEKGGQFQIHVLDLANIYL